MQDKEGSFILPEFNLNLEKPENVKFISYSQFSQYQKCPLSWKLKYIDKHKIDEPSIHTVFGSAMHTVIQSYLQVLYTSTIKKSEELDFSQMLLSEIKKTYAHDVEKYQKHFSTKEELTEFYLDGLEILNYLRKKRANYFDKKNWELIGIELPLLINPDETKEKVYLISYLDLVFRERKSKKILVFDLKTSTRGWKEWDKKDETKIAQLHLYKIFFSKLYNIPIDDIEVEFYILKRKIEQDSMYPQRRVQTFKPSQGSISVNKTKKEFQRFIDACFLPDGSYNTLLTYQPQAGKNYWNCKYCDFNYREDLCPKKNRITT